MSDWPLVRLGDVCNVQLGKMLSPKSKQGHRPRPYLRNVNVQWDRFDLREVVTMDFDEDEEEKFRLAPGDLLVCEGGEPGRAAIWRGEIPGCCYQKALHRIRPKGDAVYPQFLLYRFWSWAEAGEFVDSHGKTTIAHLPAERLRELQLALPPLPEQRQIAAKLEAGMATAARARSAAQSRLNAALKLTTSMYRQLFGGIVPLAEGVGSDLPSPPDGWKWQTLTDIARLESGHTPSRRQPDWWGGDVPWLALPDIRRVHGKVIEDTGEKINQAGLDNSSARLLPKDTVALSRTASVGFVTIFGRPMATSQDFVNWICGPTLRPRFLMHLLIASHDHIRSLAAGAIHKTIYMPAVQSFRVCVPDLTRQDEIVAELDGKLAVAETLVRQVRAEVETVEGLPSALLQSGFKD